MGIDVCAWMDAKSALERRAQPCVWGLTTPSMTRCTSTPLPHPIISSTEPDSARGGLKESTKSKAAQHRTCQSKKKKRSRGSSARKFRLTKKIPNEESRHKLGEQVPPGFGCMNVTPVERETLMLFRSFEAQTASKSEDTQSRSSPVSSSRCVSPQPSDKPQSRECGSFGSFLKCRIHATWHVDPENLLQGDVPAVCLHAQSVASQLSANHGDDLKLLPAIVHALASRPTMTEDVLALWILQAAYTTQLQLAVNWYPQHGICLAWKGCHPHYLHSECSNERMGNIYSASHTATHTTNAAPLNSFRTRWEIAGILLASLDGVQSKGSRCVPLLDSIVATAGRVLLHLLTLDEGVTSRAEPAAAKPTSFTNEPHLSETSQQKNPCTKMKDAPFASIEHAAETDSPFAIHSQLIMCSTPENLFDVVFPFLYMLRQQQVVTQPSVQNSASVALLSQSSSFFSSHSLLLMDAVFSTS